VRRIVPAGFILALLCEYALDTACAADPPGHKKPAIEILDAHTHFYDPTRKEGVPWPSKGDKLLYRAVLPDEFVKLTAQLNVVGTVVVEASPWVEDNQWLLDLAVKEKVIVGVVGRLDPASDDFERNLRRFAKEPLFRGIRFNHDEVKAGLKGKLVERCALLAELGLTLDVNGGPDMPETVARLAELSPKLRVVMNHAANLKIDGKEPPKAWRDGMAAAAKHPNVYCKVSALVEQTGQKEVPREAKYYRPVLDTLWELFGEDRLVYGSNWPVSNGGTPYETVVGIVKDYFGAKGEKVAAKFFSVNCRTAYGLGKPAEEITTSVGMRFVSLSPGKFAMGSPETEAGREAQEVQHEVTISKGFYLGKHEVTVGQFKQFVKDAKYETDGERDGKGAYGINEAGKIEEMQAKFTWKSPGFEQTDDHPVVSVSWSDAKAFCKWLSEKERKTYRLATEAEWEFACRAGTKTAYAHGDDAEGLASAGNGADATARAKFPGWSIGIKAKDEYVFTAPVGQFKPNAFGLYDMHGNVWEWCEDWYEPNSYPKEKQVDPTGPAKGNARVQRGGGWSSDAKRLRSASRVGRDPTGYRGCYLGFRVVLEQQSGMRGTESEAPKKLPAGLRVMSGGHSWSTENSAPLCQAAGITGHQRVGGPGINANVIKDVTPLLEKGEIDAYVWQHNSTGPEFPKFLPTLVDLGPKHNPNFRVLMQIPWLTQDGREDVKSPEEYEKTDLADYQARLEKSRKFVEAYVDEVNAKAGKRVVFLVPLGDGMLEVRKMIVAGKFPGITKVNYRDKPGDRGSILQGDIMPHQGHVGMRLGTYMHFAALYRMSPEGLKFPGKEGDGLTDEQRAILQKLAWDMVSMYPHAGIAKFDPPKPSKEGEKPVPKSGDGPTTVPEALKGWKATKDVPAEAVVTDYNAYIEKLPRAERPGVADVKYYADHTGRNAVAVLVKEGDKQWTHLLVYDKQHKRTEVTKFVANKLAAEPKPAPAAKPPAGLRVAYTLMSNGAEMDAIVKAANIAGHQATDAPYFGTWHGFVKGGKEGIPEKAQKQIAGDGIDALTVATWSWAPNDETWHKHVGLDSALAGVAELGLEKNPNFRLCWRAFLKPATVKKGEVVVPDFVQTKKTLEKETKDLEAHVDLVNKKHGKRVVLIVPHAQAGLALVDLVAAGKFPGVADPAELWVKEEAFNMNVHRHLRALAGYCDFAVIYGVSPEGLKPSFKGITYKSKGGAEHSMEGITDEQNAILQKIAWDTVSKYPHAGVGR
jgi:L-fuconolactonase